MFPPPDTLEIILILTCVLCSLAIEVSPCLVFSHWLAAPHTEPDYRSDLCALTGQEILVSNRQSSVKRHFENHEPLVLFKEQYRHGSQWHLLGSGVISASGVSRLPQVLHL